MEPDSHRGSSGGPSPIRLGAAAAFNVGFAVVQVVVGLAIGSVVVLADAAHQVVDAAGLMTALGAAVLLRRPATSEMSFGWGKADALGGFVSGLMLAGSVAYLAYESVSRLLDPVEVEGGRVVLIGLVAIVVNGASIAVLSPRHSHSHDHSHNRNHNHNHNHGHNHGERDTEQLALKAARLHLMTDLAGSVIVVIAGLVLVRTGWAWIDPSASLLLCGVVLWSTWSLLRRTAFELLDRTPAGVTSEAVRNALCAAPDVVEVHHIHVRPLGQGRSSVTAHVVLEGDFTVHEAQLRTQGLVGLLEHDLGVDHATLQVECHPCDHEAC